MRGMRVLLMLYILYFATGYLVIITFLLLRNRLYFTSLVSDDDHISSDSLPKVSICVPARNEESNIERCVKSALDQEYPNFQVIVLDDLSTDATPKILSTIKHDYDPSGKQLVLLKGKPKPEEWLGKPWACQQLAEAAEGKILIFADADTWFSKKMVTRVVRSMGHDVVDVLTVWPRQIVSTFWEKMIIPLVYYALLSLLPVHYVYRAPRWMPSFLRSQFTPFFAAACGQFIAFKKSAYHKIGGHQTVRDKVVEDVELARLIKSAGLTLRMYYGSQTVTCRMYRSGSEMMEGFRKNFFAGFGHNHILFGVMALLHFVVYILPAITLIWSIFMGTYILLIWSAIPVLITSTHRFLIARWFGWNPVYGLLHSVSVLWFQVLGFKAVRDEVTGNGAEWKGRPV